ncbi:E3 ubiquitin-protein ligase RAD18 isoform X2 [Pseudophryne corroboree]|uniref:E3 ubiquitin-protein ligase RAD18 isoform X2 n=1 Tax=Pseudophryne corroboree TaxID=495146 RepID=UPI0030819BA3
MSSDPDRAVQDLDDLLHCGICFDYFNIAMIIPQCSHNYCSLCIRKFLSYKTQCPICCVAVTEPELRNNRILDELVKTYVTARKHLSHLLSDSSPPSPQKTSSGKLAADRSHGGLRKKIKQEGKSMEKFLVKTKTQTPERSLGKSSDRNLFSTSTSAIKVKEEPNGEEPDVMDCSISSVPSTSIEKVKVECPVCGVGILEQYINKHLDGCLTRDEKKESLRSSVQKRKPMAKVVYNLLSERDLRKRLKEVGLSTHGSKQQLTRRHQEFVHLFNSQCDALNPKSAAEIVSEIEENEKIRSVLDAKQENVMTFSKQQSEAQIDEIHAEYRKKHRTEFQQLMEQVKCRRKASTGKKVKEEPVDCEIRAGELNEEYARPTEGPTPGDDPLHENMEESLLGTQTSLVTRSGSPVFPLSPQSRASSSSDILRDIEEAATLEETNSALRGIKRKMSTSEEHKYTGLQEQRRASSL